MKVLIFPTRDAAVEKVAKSLLDRIQNTPDSILGLATGGTMEAVYAHLRSQGEGYDCSRLTTFNLDEYVGLKPDHPQSYHHYMACQLFDHLNFDRTRTHLPAGNATNLESEANRYDELIESSNGIDLQLIGIGKNGHIGFNEPCSSFGSRTRIKTLTQSTRKSNARFFEKGEAVPKYAITMGIQTILSAKEIVVLATGTDKARACQHMIEGAIGALCPATVLQLHEKVTVVLDIEAAAHLELRDYFEVVHPAGQEVSFE